MSWCYRCKKGDRKGTQIPLCQECYQRKWGYFEKKKDLMVGGQSCTPHDEEMLSPRKMRCIASIDRGVGSIPIVFGIRPINGKYIKDDDAHSNTASLLEDALETLNEEF